MKDMNEARKKIKESFEETLNGNEPPYTIASTRKKLDHITEYVFDNTALINLYVSVMKNMAKTILEMEEKIERLDKKLERSLIYNHTEPPAPAKYAPISVNPVRTEDTTEKEPKEPEESEVVTGSMFDIIERIMKLKELVRPKKSDEPVVYGSDTTSFKIPEEDYDAKMKVIDPRKRKPGAEEACRSEALLGKEIKAQITEIEEHKAEIGLPVDMRMDYIKLKKSLNL